MSQPNYKHASSFPSTVLYVEVFAFVTDCSDCVLPCANDDTLFGATGEVGEVDEAQRMARSLLADHPHFTLERIAQAKPFQSPHVEMYLEGLRRAGFS